LKYKNKLEDTNFFLLKREIEKKNKDKKIKRMRTRLKKIAYHKLGFRDKIKNKSKFYKKIKNKN